MTLAKRSFIYDKSSQLLTRGLSKSSLTEETVFPDIAGLTWLYMYLSHDWPIWGCTKTDDSV